MHKFLLTLLVLSSTFLTLQAAPDCLDDSNYLSSTPDYKELQYVACNHDCYKDPRARLAENQGRCSVCGHYHIPRPLVVVKTPNPAAVQEQTKKTVKKSMLANLFAHNKQ